ncbi:MAG: hypothetical protein K6E90_07855 [Lachnospiraceae bacterium]|nr:hypothetical protein [Lachnospiraceae bacterium]
MRNKDVNRQVLKAISIGLTAALSLMPTVTAFADDDTSGESGSSNETNESASENTEQSENQEVRESCDKAFDACESAVELAEASFSEETASSESDGAGAPAAGESDGAGAPVAGEGDVIGAPVAGEGDVIGAPAAGESDGAGAHVADSSALGDDQIQTIIDNLTDAAQIVGITKQSPDDGNGTGLPANIENSDESGIKENDDSLENAVAALDETNKEAKTFNENHKTEDEEQKLEEAIGGAEEMVEKAKAGTATDAEVEEALEKADKAVEEAEKNKAEAERLVDKATTELEAILADCDVQYDVDPETGDITVTDEEKLDTRTRNALEKAQAAVDAARQKDADAQAALDEAQSLNKWLGMVKDQMQVVKNSTTKDNSKKNAGTKYYEGYKLAAYLQAYQVTTWDGVNPDSVEVKYDTTFKGNYWGRNYWYVKYKNAGDDCYHRVYLDLHFDKVNNLDSLIASEHLVLEEEPYAFADECNNPDNLKFGVNKDGSLIEGAITGAVDESQQAAYDAVKAEIDRLMSGNIKDATVKANLTVQMAKLYLAGQGYDIDRLDTPYWYNVNRSDKTALAKGTAGTKDDQRYIPIRYTDEDGSVKAFYFVYNISNGNAVSIYQRTPIEMTCAYNDYAEDDKHRFMLDDGDHNDRTAPDCEKRYDLNSILGQEAGYNELQYNKAKANGLLKAVENARNKVVAAQQALLNVQKVSAVYNADIQKFKDRLAAAQQEYNELKAAAEEAAGNSDNVTDTTPDGGGSTGGTTDTSTGGTTADGGSEGGTTTDGGSTDGTTSDGGSTGGGDVTEAASSDGASVDITAPAGGAGVLGETAPAAFVDLGTRPSAVDAGAFADISDIESGVLDEGGDLLEEGVLGERMAPIVDAVNNGTFKRSMLFVEDGLQVSFMWWLIMLALGAKGVQMYVKSRRKEAKETEPEK